MSIFAGKALDLLSKGDAMLGAFPVEIDIQLIAVESN
jgi:hypothetical protein